MRKVIPYHFFHENGENVGENISKLCANLLYFSFLAQVSQILIFFPGSGAKVVHRGATVKNIDIRLTYSPKTVKNSTKFHKFDQM